MPTRLKETPGPASKLPASKAATSKPPAKAASAKPPAKAPAKAAPSKGGAPSKIPTPSKAKPAESAAARAAFTKYATSVQPAGTAMLKKELAKIIRDANDEWTFLDDSEFGPFVKEAWAAAQPDDEAQVKFATFAPWYDGFVAHTEKVQADAAAAEAAKASAKEEAKLAEAVQFAGDGVWEIKLSSLNAALEASWRKGKVPLVVDATAEEGQRESGTTPLEAFYSYSGHALFEVKKMVVEVNMKKTTTLDDARDEARAKLVTAIKRGLHFVFLLSNSAPPLKSKFCCDDKLPYMLLHDEPAIASVLGTEPQADVKDAPWTKALLTPDDGVLFAHKDFHTVVVTKFERADYVGFLKEELPLEQMQHMVVTTHN